MRRRPEVLAPAGDLESLKAAVRAGADAVYLGLPSFNARARAKNFDEATFSEALAHLHEHGVHAHVTLNTLVFDDELPDVARAIATAAAAGADALIVQDLGVLALAREMAPELPIHASTQMTCTDASSVRVARSLGATRVVLARELSVADMREIRRAAPEVELEVFVHGALCVAYSGQCLTSEAIGGRSANRGACAQACRLPYELVVDDELVDIGDRAYLLSPEDLETSALVPELAEVGIVSFKIEGRLKGPDYVAGATRLYRRAVDALDGDVETPSADDRDLALATFTRGSGPGFLRGVDHQRLVDGTTCDHRGLPIGELVGLERRGDARWLVVALARDVSCGDGIVLPSARSDDELGGRIWDLEVSGRRVKAAPNGARALVWLGPDVRVDPKFAAVARPLYRSNDPTAEKRIRALTAERAHKTPLTLRVSGTAGAPLTIEARTADGREAQVTTDAVLTDADRPLDRAVLGDKLGRLGDSPFVLAAIETSLPDRGILPTGALNRARRALTAELGALARGRTRTTRSAALGELTARPLPEPHLPLPGGLFVLCRNIDQAGAALDAGADGIVLDFLELTGTGPAARALRARGLRQLVLAPPRIQKPGEEKITRYLEELAPDALLVRSLGALEASNKIPRIADFSFNVTNRLAAREVLSRQISRFVPAFDLDGNQLVKLLEGGDDALGPRAEVVIHHPMPLFHMEHCVFAALLSDGSDHRTCGRPCERHRLELRDRTGTDHPVIADVGCRNTVFHKKPQSAAELVPTLQRAGVDRFRIELVNDTREQVKTLVSAYRALVDGLIDPRELRARLRTEGGYGVVAGSLRVLP